MKTEQINELLDILRESRKVATIDPENCQNVNMKEIGDKIKKLNEQFVLKFEDYNEGEFKVDDKDFISYSFLLTYYTSFKLMHSSNLIPNEKLLVTKLYSAMVNLLKKQEKALAQLSLIGNGKSKVKARRAYFFQNSP